MKSGRRIAALAAFAMVTMAAMAAAPAGAAEPFAYQSTNADNAAAGGPHVELVSAEQGNMKLRFATDVDGYALMEYRVDGETVDFGHNWVTGGTLHPYVCIEITKWLCDEGSSSVEEPFAAKSTVEVRLTASEHPQWSFDWTTFEVDAPASQEVDSHDDPAIKDDCRKGGWAEFGFSNQGQCISFLMTGKNRR